MNNNMILIKDTADRVYLINKDEIRIVYQGGTYSEPKSCITWKDNTTDEFPIKLSDLSKAITGMVPGSLYKDEPIHILSDILSESTLDFLEEYPRVETLGDLTHYEWSIAISIFGPERALEIEKALNKYDLGFLKETL